MAQKPGKQLLQASFALFRQDPKMIWLPIAGAFLSIVGAIIVGGVVAALLALINLSNAFYLVALFAALLTVAFVSAQFNVAVVFAATDRIEGRTPTIKGSLAQAWKRRGKILRWAVVSAIVGVVISAIEDRMGTAGKIMGALGGAAWGVATFFIIPVLAFEDLGPLAAVEHSAALLKQRFGTVAKASVRFGFLFLGWLLLAVAVIVAGVLVRHISVPAAAVLILFGVVGIASVAAVASTASIYLRTVLYRFATGQSVPDLGVDLGQAFQKR